MLFVTFKSNLNLLVSTFNILRFESFLAISQRRWLPFKLYGLQHQVTSDFLSSFYVVDRPSIAKHFFFAKTIFQLGKTKQTPFELPMAKHHHKPVNQKLENLGDFLECSSIWNKVMYLFFENVPKNV